MIPVREAAAIASSYAMAAKDATSGSHEAMRCVVLKPGYMRATDGVRGCEIPCDIDVSCAVHADVFARMIRQCGKKPKLKFIKGRKLEIKGDGARYTLQAIPEEREPSVLAPPSRRGWVDVDEPTMAALRRLEAFCDPKAAPSPALSGVRLTPSWAAAFGGQERMVVLWAPKLVHTAVTVPVGLFLKVDTAAQMLVHQGAAFLKTADGQIRYSMLHVGGFADGTIESAFVNARGNPSRYSGKINGKDFMKLCKRAEAVVTSKVDGLALRLDPRGSLDIEGTVKDGPYGAQEFSGSIEADVQPARKVESVGIAPGSFRKLADVVVSGTGDHQVSISTAGKRAPVLVWGGAPVVEALALPVLVG